MNWDEILDELMNDDKLKPLVESILIAVIETLAEQFKQHPEIVGEIVNRLLEILKRNR